MGWSVAARLATGIVLLAAPGVCPAGSRGRIHSPDKERAAPPPTSLGTAPAYVPNRRGRLIRCTIAGTEHDGVLVGTAGDDVLCGLGGDDVLTGGAGDDLLAGGAGDDTAAYVESPHPVLVRLDRGASGDGRDLLSGVENVVGSPRGDLLVGGHGPNVLKGGPGADRLDSRDRSPYDLLDGGGGNSNLCLGDPGDRWRNCEHALVRSHRRAVPILMYHVIGNPSRGTPFEGLWVSPKDFARQMGYLDRHGYEVVSLQDVYDYWHGGPLPAKPVVVSFDDGFDNQYTKALPILAAHGWAGTLNLTLSHYQHGWGLTKRQVRGLIRGDWELDDHTRTHAYLPGLDAASLAREVSGSRRFLRRTFRVPVNFFAYPSGAYDSRVVAAVRKAGFQAATTTRFGLARPDELFTLARIRVERGDTVAGLAAKLRR